MHTGKIRTIIRDRRFEQEMAHIEPNARRADEFLEGAETVLSRQPDAGYQLDDAKVWLISGHTVDLVLYYTFDENNVYLLSIEKMLTPQL